MISCGARLAVFDIAELREVTAYDELELDTLGDRKTALFLIMSDTDDSFMMGYITVRTTTVSEFVASMKKLHLPEQIIIPMSVIFRFFPTVVEEYNAIGDAMKMRGIRFGGGKASAMLEYRLVPVIMCSVKIGEELNAAALTRGLGGPVKRTNICEIGFHVQDVFFLLLCVVAFAIPIVTMITGR